MNQAWVLANSTAFYYAASTDQNIRGPHAFLLKGQFAKGEISAVHTTTTTQPEHKTLGLRRPLISNLQSEDWKT